MIKLFVTQPPRFCARLHHPKIRPMAEDSYPKVGHFKTAAEFQKHLHALRVELPVDDRILSAAEGSPLATPLKLDEFTIGNRWCVHPMEGWDGTTTGEPSEHTVRRWRHF